MAGPLDAAENERIFASEILPRYLGLIPPSRSVRTPVGIVMGGQMGAGKSRLSALLARGTSPPAIVVDADEFRELHPAYAELKRTDPAEAIRVTGWDSSLWTQRLVEALARRKAHIVVEGTMRRTEPFEDTSTLLRFHGYAVEAALLAVSPLVSWQATVQRAEELHALGEGMRVVERQLHDEAVEGMLATVDRICGEGLADRVTVWTRGMTCLLDMRLIEGAFPDPSVARRTVVAERERVPTPEEIHAHDGRWARVLDLMSARRAPGTLIAETERRRADDAERMGRRPDGVGSQPKG